jgi:cytosine deaminase
MLVLRNARIPLALLPDALATPAPDPLEPSVRCDLRIEGARIVSVERAGGGSTPPIWPAAPRILRDPAAAAAPDRTGGSGAVGGSPTKVHPEAGAAVPKVVDLDDAIVFPGFVDAHVHLDKTHTWDRAPNRTGTFFDALETLGRDKDRWTRPDLLRRAGFALRCAWEHGTRVIRTHVDTGLPWAETSHAAMAELRAQWAGRLELQTVPLCGLDAYGGAQGEAIADLALKYGASALGGFSLMSPELPEYLDRLMAVARERGVGLDFHVDENGRVEAEVLRLVAEAVLRNEFPHPVVCGHCCSLAVQPVERQRSTLALVQSAGIRIISLPLCNLYLQDRRAAPTFPLTPQWRGLTLIHDLLDLGVPVACASDNVRDAFYAFGDMDAVEVYVQSVRLAHLDSRLAESVKVVTSTAADIIGAEGRGRIAPGARAQLVVLAARSFSELLSRPGGPRRLVEGEELRTAHVPNYAELNSSVPG